MHDEGSVNGSLRLQNILVVNKIIHILDFDWAGVEGGGKISLGIEYLMQLAFLMLNVENILLKNMMHTRLKQSAESV